MRQVPIHRWHVLLVIVSGLIAATLGFALVNASWLAVLATGVSGALGGAVSALIIELRMRKVQSVH